MWFGILRGEIPLAEGVYVFLRSPDCMRVFVPERTLYIRYGF